MRGKLRLALWCVVLCVILSGLGSYAMLRFGYGEPYLVTRPDSSRFTARTKIVEWLPGPAYVIEPSSGEPTPQIFNSYRAVGETMCESPSDAIRLARAAGPPWSLWELQAQRNGRVFEVSFRNGNRDVLQVLVGTNHCRTKALNYPVMQRGCGPVRTGDEPEMLTVSP